MHKMNKWRWSLFRWLVKRIVTQGGHGPKITEAYRIIHDEAQLEFSEENWISTNSFLIEKFEDNQLNVRKLFDRSVLFAKFKIANKL